MISPTLSPATSIQALSIFSAFCLRVIVGYAICLVIARAAVSADFRFFVWLSFLIFATLYWVYCLFKLISPMLGSTARDGSRGAAAALSSVLLSDRAISCTGLFLSIAGVVYCIILGAAIVIEMLKYVRLVRVLRYRVLAPRFIQEALDRVRTEMTGPNCRIWLLPGLPSPASLGWLEPCIYLPLDEAEPNNDLRDVLCHEYAHLRRRDGLSQVLAVWCRWTLFFHPLVHKAFSSMQLERELACDALVLEQGTGSRAQYAETLVRFGWKANVASGPDHVGIGFTSQSAVLTARVRLILAGERVYSKWSRGLRALVSSMACCLFIATAPALWIVFAMQPLSPQTAAIPVSVPGHKRLHRKTPSTRTNATIDQVSNAEQISRSAHLRDTPSQSEHRQVFHIQNAEEPMSNPVVSEEASTQASQRGSPSGISPKTAPLIIMPTAPIGGVNPSASIGGSGMGGVRSSGDSDEGRSHSGHHD